MSAPMSEPGIPIILENIEPKGYISSTQVTEIV